MRTLLVPTVDRQLALRDDFIRDRLILGLIEHPETVVDAVDLDAALRGRDDRILEALPPLIRTPDEGLEIDVVFRSGDRVEHIRIE